MGIEFQHEKMAQQHSNCARQVTEKALMSLEEPMLPGQEPKWAPKQVGANSKKHPWEDMELGPLIGQGSFGKVYRGVWNGAPVAVKVRCAVVMGGEMLT